MAKVELRVPAIITPWRRYCGEEHVGRPTLVPPRAVPARSRSGPGRTRRIGGRHGRAGDAPLGWASPAAGAWTRAITSPRLDRPHQLDGALADAVAVPPAARARGVGGDRLGMAWDRELVGDVAHRRRGGVGRVVEEGAEQPHRAELDSHAQTVVVAAVPGDEGAVGVVEVEVARELVGRGVAREAAVAAGLVVGEEADRHRPPTAGTRRGGACGGRAG